MAEITPGPVVTGGDVEQAALHTLREWVPFYLARLDVTASRDPGTTIPPRSYEVVSDDARWEDQTPPALVVVSPGTVDDPELHNAQHGSYSAVWQLNVGVTVSGATEHGTRDLAHRHGAAVLLALTQQPDLNGIAEATWWKGTRLDAVAVDQRRRLLAVEVLAHVYVPRTVDTRGLIPRELPDPVTDPAGDSPAVSGSRVLITRRTP